MPLAAPTVGNVSSTEDTEKRSSTERRISSITEQMVSSTESSFVVFCDDVPASLSRLRAVSLSLALCFLITDAICWIPSKRFFRSSSIASLSLSLPSRGFIGKQISAPLSCQGLPNFSRISCFATVSRTANLSSGLTHTSSSTYFKRERMIPSSWFHIQATTCSSGMICNGECITSRRASSEKLGSDRSINCNLDSRCRSRTRPMRLRVCVNC